MQAAYRVLPRKGGAPSFPTALPRHTMMTDRIYMMMEQRAVAHQATSSCVPTTQNYAPGCRYPATAVPPRRYFRRQLLSTATGRDFQTLHRHASEGSEPGCALQSAPRRSFISAIGRRHYQLLQGHQTQAKVSIRRQAGRWTYLYKFGTAVAWGERGTCRTGVASISCNRLSSVQNLHRPRVVMLPRSSLSRRGCSVRRRSAGNDKQLASLGASPPPMAIRAARSCSSSRQNASILVR